MTIVVFGGTGQIGRALVPQLVAAGKKVRVITRDAEKAAALPAGVEGFVADLDRADTLRPALEGAEAVFLLIANSPIESHQGLTVLSVILDAKPRHLVYLSNDISQRTPIVPHAGAKLGIEAAVRAGGVPYTILRPTYFMQNDAMGKAAIMNGAYAVPCGLKPLHRVDTRDVADAAARALLDGTCEGRAVLLSSGEEQTGPEAAELWSQALGRTVVFPDLTAEEWGEIVKPYMPEWLHFDLMLMYRNLRATGSPARPAEMADQALLLPDGPRSYGAYIAGTAADWLAES
ncbi:SDR family oxidoreductase [Chachezhania sediminis]|uniref:SDR family oxidoreductase n=1 Tax=Chachezhania sediminis TaxID=2599291 RepID=UPI00131E256E|nr:NmrA family NAD(P)-binding protein [Chachezhania sediminis]